MVTYGELFQLLLVILSVITLIVNVYNHRK